MDKVAIITVLLILTIYYFLTILQMNTSYKFSVPAIKQRGKTNTEIKCYLKDILIAINYNWPNYDSLPILKKFYGDVFGKIVFCGNDKHEEVIQIVEKRGFYGYECVQRAIEMYPNFTGYIHSNDDVLLQWWNVAHLNKNKIWLGTDLYEDSKRKGKVYDIKNKTPNNRWWQTSDPFRNCGNAFYDVNNFKTTDEGKKLGFDQHIKNFYLNSKNRDICLSGRSDFFYIPKQFAFAYAKMSQVFRKRNVHLEIAIPTSLFFFLTHSNYININGTYLPDKYKNTKYALGAEFEDIFSFQTSFYHPFKLSRTKNLHLFKGIVIPYGYILRELCLTYSHGEQL